MGDWLQKVTYRPSSLMPGSRTLDATRIARSVDADEFSRVGEQVANVDLGLFAVQTGNQDPSRK